MGVKLGCLKFMLFLGLGVYHYALLSKNCFCCILPVLVCCISIFNSSQGIFYYSWFLHGPTGYSVVCLFISPYLWIFQFSSYNWFLVIDTIVVGKDAWFDFSPLKNINLFCELTYDLSWRMFHVHLRIILFCWFYILLYWFSILMTDIHWCMWGIKVP